MVTVLSETDNVIQKKGADRLKRGFAKMCKGGFAMDVTNTEQAKIAEAAEKVGIPDKAVSPTFSTTR